MGRMKVLDYKGRHSLGGISMCRVLDLRATELDFGIIRVERTAGST